jgi:hypothetical protein
MSMLDSAFKACTRAGVPIVAIQSPDQQATIAALNGLFGTKRPLLKWDICGGLSGLNDKGKRAAQQTGIEPTLTQNPIEALTIALKLPDQSLIFVQNIHLFLEQPTLIQAIANVRDQFKSNQRVLVLLGPSFTFGPELVRDVIVIDEPLPPQVDIETVVKQQFVNAQLAAPKDAVVSEAAKILLGCSAFEAEQITATSLSKNGVDFELLWQKKKLLIGQTPGMSLWDGKQTFDQIGGLQQWKTRLTRVINGRADIGLILFFDEVEKMFGGATSDSSGVSQDFHGQWLTWAQDNEVLGAILVGASGGGKSLSSKASGSVKTSGRIPVLSCDVGAMKSSLVGSSEARFRNFLKVARALTPGRILVIMTCNDLAGLSPELKARMTLGTFFFDFPSEAERASIWPLYLQRYELGTTYEDVPEELRTRQWTGREIKAACETAWNEGITLMDAAENIVPVSITDADRMNRLRELAHNSFLSASYPGPYRRGMTAADLQGTTRAIETKSAWDDV